jgi:hypothetical protein
MIDRVQKPLPWVRAIASLLAIAAGSTLARAQDFRATVTGVVTDASGAALPGVKVGLTRLATNTTVVTMTNDDGHYVAPFLHPGSYRVVAAHPRLQPCVRDVELGTAERRNVDIRLDTGVAAETVQVRADRGGEGIGGLLAGAVPDTRIAELPLNGRQVFMLMQLTAGTLNNQTTFREVGAAGTRAWDLNGNYSIHGSRPESNEFLIDGAPHSATGGWQYAPLVDAVQEIKVQAAAVDASYGRTSGGVVNLTLKSGTNDLHGAVFLFHRGDALDANTTQNNRQGIAKRGHRFDNYGAVLSGPIRRDRTFFMVYFDGFRDTVPSPRTVTVPTERQRAGDFSETYNSAGQLVTIYDPLTTRPDPDRPGRYRRDPFPGNKIPAERWSPAAVRLLAHIPPPNVPGEARTGAGNYLASPNVGSLRYDSYLVRIDHHFSARHRLFATTTGNWGAEFRSENGLPGPALRGNWPRGREHSMSTLDHVAALGERSVLNLRASLDRFDSFNTSDYAALTEDLGITTPFQVIAQYPLLTFDGYESVFPATPRRTVNTIVSGQANVSVGWRRHALRAGGEVRSYRIERANGGEGQGRFNFNRAFTQRDPLSADAASGNAFASYLLGYPASGGVDVASDSDRRYLYGAFFVQDEWRLTPRLTLSLGLRWEHQAPVTERHDRLTVGFDRTSPSPLSVPGQAVHGGLLFPTAERRSPYAAEYSDVQPRVGASYRASDSLVLRALGGRSYLPLTSGGQEGFHQTGFSIRTPFVAQVETGVPFATLDRPYPSGLQSPPGSTLGLATQAGSSVVFVNPAFEIPFADQWALGVTLELFRRLTLDAAYVGSRTRRLPINGRAINEVPLADRLRAAEDPSHLLATVPNPFAGLLPGTPLDAATVPRGQLLRPHPQFTDVTMDKDNAGWAHHDALEITARGQWGGAAAVVTYVWGRSREALGYTNNGYDTRPWSALASFDRTHRLTASLLWQLPSSRRLGALLTGWQVNAIGEIQSGTPTAMPGGARLVSPSAALAEGQGLDRWFDNSTKASPRPDGTWAWEVLPPFALSSLGPRLSDVRDPWAPQWTLALVKNTPLRGRCRLQLRLEAFNAFNTPIYAGPDTSVASPRFGRLTPDQINFPRHVQLGARVTF